MRKKINYIGAFLLLIFGFITIGQIVVKAYSNDSKMKNGNWISNIYVRKDNESIGRHKYQQGRFLIRANDNHFVYCLQPYVDLNETDIYASSEDYRQIQGLTFNQWQKIKLASYYGYQYDGADHSSDSWYMITQVYIWKTVSPDSDIYFTDKLNGNRISKFENEFAELESLINSHYVTPNFGFSQKDMIIGTSETFYDNNNVLERFNITNTAGVSATKNGNALTITPTDVGSNMSITLTKQDIKYQVPPLVYYHPTGQNVMTVGSYDPIPVTIKINVLGGKVSMKKIDKDTNLGIGQGDATLNGATYGIYKTSDNTRVGNLVSKGGEYVTSGFLPSLGNFYLLEEEPSIGYEIDNTKYFFDITKDNLYSEIIVKEKVIERDFQIFKVYANDSTGIMTGEPNATFEIYLKSSNQLYKTITTNKKGFATAKLPFGTYVVKQTKGTTDHELAKPFEIVINKDTDNPLYKIIANKEIMAKLKVIKVDKDSGKVIEQSGIKFKIKSLKTNEYVCQTISYPTAMKICEFETDKNGVLITPYALSSGKYQLEEVDQRLDGYLWNQEALQFEIGENSTLVSDDTYGALIEVRFENKKVTGKLEINKVGEDLIFDEDTYHYDSKSLEGITFNLYMFKDNEYKLIHVLKTDKDGHISIDNLELGKYLLMEKETLDGYVIDGNKYEFELIYKDQYTPTITKTYTLKNYLKKGTIEFTKTDLTTGAALEGVEIEIHKEDGTLIYRGTTDKNGKVIIDNLFVGKFYIIETKSKDGYELSQEKIHFEILENGQIVKANMTNQLIEVPNTLANKSIIPMTISLILFVLGLGIIVYEKKKK